MSYVVQQPHSNTNPSEKYRVTDYQSWLRFVNGDSDGYEFTEHDTAVEAQREANRRNAEHATRNIRELRSVRAMVALDTVDVLSERVLAMLAHGRRMTVVCRLIHPVDHLDNEPTILAGLIVDGPPRVERGIRAELFVTLRTTEGPRTEAFGFAVGHEDVTEADAWARYRDNTTQKRVNFTWVSLTGGMPGDGPALDDQIIIRRWNSHGVCRETIVAFDYGTVAMEGDPLIALRDELREHMAGLRDKQPWENKSMLELALRTLEGYAPPERQEATQ